MRYVFLAALLALTLTSTVAAARPNETRRMLVTGYKSCDPSIARVKPCNGMTRSGRQVQWGLAACGRSFAFGTVFEVPNLGFFACYDRGGGVTDNILDIWMPDDFSLPGGSRWRQVIVHYDIDPQEVLDGNYVTEEMAGWFAATRPGAAADGPVPTAARVAGSSATGVLNAQATRDGQNEHTLGNLVTDMLRTQYNAEIAMIHNGGLHANLPAGEIQATQVLAAVGPDQKPLSLDLRGEQIKHVIEHGLTYLRGSSHGWLSLSGVHLVYNPNAPEGQRIVSLVKADTGEPIWDGKYYRVILTDALYLTEGFTPILEGGRGLITYEPLAHMASKWLAQRGPATPALEGRIKPGS